jgi:transcriptional regulator of NAD metabolism
MEHAKIDIYYEYCRLDVEAETKFRRELKKIEAKLETQEELQKQFEKLNNVKNEVSVDHNPGISIPTRYGDSEH